ncbi:unnamed protein product [Strongylus vulgaris]|uniref:Uncharacterized protein n=1 Tax=Strongylus vulgaris TaxID=40348 RepID=A0A3P7J7N7_STRVU|nr:unnamed protein product [Strongylus vulgaris]
MEVFPAVRSDFEMDMEYELDQLITDYANEHLSGNVKKEKVQAVSAKEVGFAEFESAINSISATQYFVSFYARTHECGVIFVPFFQA